MNYPISIITPSGKVFEGKVDSAIAPGTGGIFEVLAGHAPMITTLRKGVVTLRENSNKTQFSIGPGVFEVDQAHQALLLTDFATPVGDEKNVAIFTSEKVNHN